jgi:hypothetical protein
MQSPPQKAVVLFCVLARFSQIVCGDLAMFIFRPRMSAVLVRHYPVSWADKFGEKEVKGGVPFLGEKGLGAGFYSGISSGIHSAQVLPDRKRSLRVISREGE